jgi:uncharacterized protein
MFNQGNDDYLTHPKYIPETVVDNIVRFLVEGVTALQIKKVGIIFHGGEPMMLQKRRFAAFCEKLTRALAHKTQLALSMQTNAMLVDDAWIAIFEKYRIKVGVSLDGPAIYHDQERVDHLGRGTHARTVNGLRRLQAAHQQNRINAPGAICVINPAYDAKTIYRHFVDELGLQFLSFNLPMKTHDDFAGEAGANEVGATTRFIETLFDEWVADDNPKIKIRLFDNMFRFFSGDKVFQQMLPEYITQQILVVIASNGDISENDDFKMIHFAQQGGNVNTTPLTEFANSPLRAYIREISHRLAQPCQQCDWQNYCLAGVSHGLTVSRYGTGTGFANPSVFCQTFQALFERGARYLLRNGLSIEVLKAGLDSEPYRKARAQPLASPTRFLSKTIPIISVTEKVA